MKRTLFQLILLFLPFFVFAQNQLPVIKNLTGKILGIDNSFKLNDHVSVIQTNIDNENFELIAINEKAEVLWRTQIKGYAIGAGKFKGKILVIASEKFTENSKIVGPYTATQIDEQTGRILLSKVIYKGSDDYQEVTQVSYTEDGLGFTLAIRQTGTAKPTTLFGKNLFFQTRDFTLIKLTDNLDATIIKPKIAFEGLSTFWLGPEGNLYIFNNIDGGVKVSKFEDGKTEPSAIITTSTPYVAASLDRIPLITASSSDKNIFYYASVKDGQELFVCKVDFNNNTSESINEVFDSKHVKSIKNSYVPFNKDLHKPEFTDRFGLAVRYLKEYNGTLFVTLSNRELQTPSKQVRPTGGSSLDDEGALLINGYDLNLKQKFQQWLPLIYGYIHYIDYSYHCTNNSLYIVANNIKFRSQTYLCQLDLNTGNWLKMDELKKDEFGRAAHSDQNVLFFKDNYIIPYLGPRGILAGKEGVDLKAYNY